MSDTIAEAIAAEVSEQIAETQAAEAQAEAVEALTETVETLAETVETLAEANAETTTQPTEHAATVAIMSEMSSTLAEIKTLLTSREVAEEVADSETPLEIELPPITQIQEAPPAEKNPILKFLFG